MKNEKLEALQGGYFVSYIKGQKPQRIKNTLFAQGAQWFLRTVFRGEAVLPATYYLGLTSVNVYNFDTTTLANLAAGEPVGNGYARQALVKNTVDWSVSEVNGAYRALSKVAVFTCSTAPWTTNWQRMFLCDAAAGTAGNVISISGPSPLPNATAVGLGPSIQYEFWLRG